MGTLTYPYTLTAGQPENVNQLNSNLNAIASVINGGIANVNLSGSAGITDANLASPMTGVWRTIARLGPFGTYAGMSTSYLFMGTHANNTPCATGVNSSPSGWVAPVVTRLVGADHAVAGKTTKIRLTATFDCNDTAPGVNFDMSWTTFTVGGTTGLTYTLGSGGGVVTFTTPSANASTYVAQTETTFPSDGNYLVYVKASGSVAAGHAGFINAQLQVRNV